MSTESMIKPEFVTGNIEIVAVLYSEKEPLRKVKNTLGSMVENFVKAVNIKMFSQGKASLISPVAHTENGKFICKIQVDQLPKHSFSVLRGMFEFFHLVQYNLQHYSAYQFSSDNLFESSPPVPEFKEPLSEKVSFEDSQSSVTGYLEIQIEFVKAVAESDNSNRFKEELMVWDGILQGGYPIGGPGESGTGAVNVNFLNPFTLRFVAEDWVGDENCFVPLLHMIEYWETTDPVHNVDISIM